MSTGIYSIVHIESGKRYIGSSDNIERRIRTHKRMLTKGNHPNIHLQRVWDKYGEEMFAFSIIELCNPVDLIVKEQTHINIKADYNIIPKAYDPPTFKGLTHSPETRAKMSAAQSGENHAMYGRHHTDSAKEKLREASTGRKHTSESLAKMRESNKHLKTWLGRQHSPDTRTKMSISAERLWAERLSNGYKVKKHSEETKAKMRITGKLASDRTPPEVRSARAYKAWETKRENRIAA